MKECIALFLLLTAAALCFAEEPAENEGAVTSEYKREWGFDRVQLIATWRIK